jgi:glycosyltransferase involved in cell wall biosynthesis
MISIIVTTYNRCDVLSRAINSVLAQDYSDWELILVDDGSTDNTEALLKTFVDDRIRFVRHPTNRGVNAAKNTGFDNIRGEWFTTLDSDDEMIAPEALSTFMRIPREIDPNINAITCNCIDSVTGKYTGLGLDRDQFLDWKTILQKCRGEHWGLTRTSLLAGDRLNERIRGFENILWTKIDRRAHRYYLHKALRIYHSEGDDRITKETIDEGTKTTAIYESYCAIMEETEFLHDCQFYAPNVYRGVMFSAGVSFIANDDTKRAFRVLGRLATCPGARGRGMGILFGILFGERSLDLIRKLKGRLAMRNPKQRTN